MTQVSYFSQEKNSQQAIKLAFANLKLPHPDSHKGQNGKLLIIGGSQLFHVASKWSLDIASKFVDMVFYASVPDNNELIKQAKSNFWNGIVIERPEIINYINEADCVLIGPGMERQNLSLDELKKSIKSIEEISKEDWQKHTDVIVNSLLASFPSKKWVIDAGALQMILPTLLNANCIITPHAGEMAMLKERLKLLSTENTLPAKEQSTHYNLPEPEQVEQAQLGETKATILLKGKVDQVVYSPTSTPQQIYYISGGNAGMTKGGTGDVLAGLAAGLYCTNDALTSCLVASYSNKATGDLLYQRVGPFFNASDLLGAIPEVLWQMASKANQD